MKAIAFCGLACCVCSENKGCVGCQDLIEAYPFAHNENHSYHGPLSMYKKNGFEVCGQIEGCIVCRKIL